MEKLLIDFITLFSQLGVVVRWAVIIIGLVITAYILYKNKTEKALTGTVSSLESTIDAYKEEILIKDRRIETLVDQIKKCDESVKLVETENAILKAKTDLTSVMIGIQTIGESYSKEHAYNIEANKQKIEILQHVITTT